MIWINLVAILLVTIFWMLGGQFGSAFRKYGIMGISIIMVGLHIKYGFFWANYIPIIPFCAILFLGYGEKSWFMKLLKSDELVRIADALAILLPLLIMNFLTHRPVINYFIQTGLLGGAFQTRLGSFKIGTKDFILDDLLRGPAVGCSLVLSL